MMRSREKWRLAAPLALAGGKRLAKKKRLVWFGS
jgi:hypothetical protein